MNITRSSIELVSPSVSSGTSCPTTQRFLFFGHGFHTATEALLPNCRKTLLKYIHAIFGNLFYGTTLRFVPTAYKLSKNDIDIIEKKYIKVKYFPPYIPALADGDFPAVLVNGALKAFKLMWNRRDNLVYE